MELVDKQHDLPLRRRHLAQHGLESLLELAAELGSCQERAHVERPDLATAQTLRHVAGNDAHGEALGNGGFANAWLADQYRIVFRTPREDLDDSTNFVVSANHWIDLASLGRCRQVAGVLLQRVVEILGIRIGHALPTTDVLETFQERGLRHVLTTQNVFCGTRVLGERDQDVFRRNIVVAHLLRFLRGTLERFAQCQ